MEYKVIVADKYIKRLFGLIISNRRTRRFMVFPNCSRIHTWFMQFPIYVYYFSEKWELLDGEHIEPWCIGKKVNGCKHIIEATFNANYQTVVSVASSLHKEGIQTF